MQILDNERPFDGGYPASDERGRGAEVERMNGGGGCKGGGFLCAKELINKRQGEQRGHYGGADVRHDCNAVFEPCRSVLIRYLFFHSHADFSVGGLSAGSVPSNGLAGGLPLYGHGWAAVGAACG